MHLQDVPLGFTRWDGVGTPPEVHGRRVEVIFRSRHSHDTIFPYHAGLAWNHVGDCTDIVAYRIVHDIEEEAGAGQGPQVQVQGTLGKAPGSGGLHADGRAGTPVKSTRFSNVEYLPYPAYKRRRW